MMKPIVFISIFLMYFVTCSQSVDATTLEYQTLDDLIKRSSSIIEGTVVRKTYQPGSEHYVMSTAYEICNISVIYGAEVGDCMLIVVPGGKHGGKVSGFEGMPELQRGDNFIFFLTEMRKYNSPFTSWWQGLFRIHKDDQKVISYSGHPVLGVDKNGHVLNDNTVRLSQDERDSNKTTFVYSEGFEVGSPSKSEMAKAVNKEEFKSIVHERILKLKASGKEIDQNKRLPEGWGPNLNRRFE